MSYKRITASWTSSLPRSRRISARSSKSASSLAWGVPLALALALLLGRAAGFRFAAVQGGSMAPALRSGDLLLLHDYGGEPMRPGEVVQWRTGSTSVVHRIRRAHAEKGRATYETKGDANRDGDRELRSGPEVAGRVALVVPKLGLLPAALRTPWGFALGVLVPGAALLASYARSIRSFVRNGTGGRL